MAALEPSVAEETSDGSSCPACELATVSLGLRFLLPVSSVSHEGETRWSIANRCSDNPLEDSTGL